MSVIEIIVADGDKKYTCKVHRPDFATMSRVNKLMKTDEVLAAQEMLKGCWEGGDEAIKSDVYLTLAAVGQMQELQKGIRATVKNS